MQLIWSKNACPKMWLVRFVITSNVYQTEFGPKWNWKCRNYIFLSKNYDDCKNYVITKLLSTITANGQPNLNEIKILVTPKICFQKCVTKLIWMFRFY